ncbi:MAG: ferritin family protein [Bacillota bacterium]
MSHEQICITKYSGYASRTRDPEIRRMFHEFASDEQQHYDTINNLLQQSGQSQGQWQAKAQQQPGSQAGKRHQAGSQGAGWQATAQPGGTGIQELRHDRQRGTDRPSIRAYTGRPAWKPPSHVRRRRPPELDVGDPDRVRRSDISRLTIKRFPELRGRQRTLHVDE